jgi:hypothetical protein
VFEKTPVRYRGYSLCQYFFRRFVLKNRLDFLRMAACMVLATAFVFIGCATSSGVTELPSLEGAWKNQGSSAGITFVFADDTRTLIQNGAEQQSGTFVQSADSIKFTIGKGGKGTWKQSYSLKDNVLNLAQVPGHNFGSYTKEE